MRQLKGSAGQGVMEVLVVIGVFGALVAAGLPAYIGFQERRADKTAHANLEAAVPAAQAYHWQHGTYKGLNSVVLFRTDPRVSPEVVVSWARRGTFCLADTVRGKTWSVSRSPSGHLSFRANADCS